MLLRFVARRLILLLVALLVSSFVIFGSLYLSPGSPLSVLSGGRAMPPAALHALQLRYHLNQPFLAQYWYWLTGVFHGNLGESIMYREPVATVISQHAVLTIELVLYAALIIVTVGIGMGVLAALRPGWVDGSVIVVTTVFAAMPSFVAAVLLITLFAVTVHWFPALGPGQGLADSLYHLTLPAIALAVSSMAIVSRVTRVAVRTELSREHVQTATSRGIPRRLVIRRHVLRNAAIPIATVTGITIASLIAVSAVVEQAFSLNGLGETLVQAASSKDLAVVQGIALVLVTAFVVVNMLVDLLYAILDPTVSLGARAQ